MRGKLLVIVILLSFSEELEAQNEDETPKNKEREKRTTKMAGPKGDYGFLLQDEQRTKRSAEKGNQNPVPSSFGTPSLQTSYFLGQCLMCPPGGPGPRGPPGSQGLPGRDGRDGRDQPLSVIADNHTHEIIVVMSQAGEPTEDATTEENPFTGTTYIHWGKNTCPEQSELVYAGVVGGKAYTDKGSGTNYLCLHSNPTFDRPRAGRNYGAYIHGTEFESGAYAGIPGLSQEYEVACSVCLANSKHDVLMIPGVNSCPDGQDWTEEYHGYLTAMHSSYYATEFICMDHEAENIPRSGHDNDPSLLYMVEGVCVGHGGGLPCPPYVDGYEITCVICSL